MILSICSNSSVLEVIRIVKIVIDIICYVVVPCGLIVTLMLNYASAIKVGDEDLLAKANKALVPKLIAAVAVFMVPVFVKIVVNIAGGDNEYINCIGNATKAGVAEARYDEVQELVSYAEESLKYSDYMAAKTAIQKLDDEALKQSLLSRLESVETYIEIEKAVAIAETTKEKSDYDKALSLVEGMPNVKIKERLQERLKEAERVFISDDTVDTPTGATCSPDPQMSSDGLKKLHGTSIVTVLEQNGSSVAALEKEIYNSVRAVGIGTRRAPAAAAKTLINKLKSYGYKMDYFWGGKYKKIGINSKWGTNIGPSSSCHSHADPSCCRVRSIYSSFDCSGFVAWALVNGLQDESLEQQQTRIYSTDVSLKGKTTAICKVGDVLVNGGHIVLIIGIDTKNKKYNIAESSNGVTIGTKNFDEAGYYCRDLESLYIKYNVNSR